MPKLPRISGAQAIRALEKLGFEQVRQKGSHVVLRRDQLGCVVPPQRTKSWNLGWHLAPGQYFTRRVCSRAMNYRHITGAFKVTRKRVLEPGVNLAI